MRRLAFFITFLMSYLFYGFYISTHKFQIRPELDAGLGVSIANTNDIFDYRGVTHSHTRLSSGIGPPKELIDDALEAGLDFLFITDSNIFNHARHLEGYHDNLLVFVSEEYEYLDSKFLHFSPDNSFASLGEAHVRFADILSNRNPHGIDDFLVLTHPLLPGYSWDRPYPSGLAAIEVFNFKSIWQNSWKRSALAGAWSILVYPFNPDLALIRLYDHPKSEFDLWDRLNRERKTVGFLGHEATARALPFKGVPIRFPAYEKIFRIASNHVLLRSELTGNETTDAIKIRDALRSGSFYMSFDILGNPKGFQSYLSSKGQTHLPGAQTRLAQGDTLRVQIPQSVEGLFEVRYLQDGQIVRRSDKKSSQLAISEAGVYRIEVWIEAPLPFPDSGKKMIWIATNPFFISGSLPDETP